MTIIADSHIHFHHCFDPNIFLKSALLNFNMYASEPQDDGLDKVLLLTESAGTNFFNQLLVAAQDKADFSGWKISLTDENCSLSVCNLQGDKLLLIAGRQIVSRENLEVLALGTAQLFSDGAPLDETVQAVQGQAALVILPWGFGKWSGGRGQTIDRYIDSIRTKQDIFIGDNGNRCTLMPRPAQFDRAEKIGLRVLPGSDPLPFSAQQNRAGSYGFILPGRLNPSTPKESLFTLLRRLDSQPAAYGRRENLVRFVYYQFAMQFRKHMPFLGGN